MKLSILRFASVQRRYGKGRSATYSDIAQGLFTKPVKLGPRTAGWPDNEVDAIIAARIAGSDKSAIRRLVETLHQARLPGITRDTGVDDKTVTLTNVSEVSES